MQIINNEEVWTEGATPIGKCDDCGREVMLYSFTNTCECGAEYNTSGQKLAPRSQWGAETGETHMDIIN